MLYQDQDNISYSLDTEADLTGYTTAEILYRKPDGTTGAWTATVSTTFLTYEFQDGDIDQTGVWDLQTYVVIGGKKSYGNIVKEIFELPLNA